MPPLVRYMPLHFLHPPPEGPGPGICPPAAGHGSSHRWSRLRAAHSAVSNLTGRAGRFRGHRFWDAALARLKPYSRVRGAGRERSLLLRLRTVRVLFCEPPCSLESTRTRLWAETTFCNARPPGGHLRSGRGEPATKMGIGWRNARDVNARAVTRPCLTGRSEDAHLGGGRAGAHEISFVLAQYLSDPAEAVAARPRPRLLECLR